MAGADRTIWGMDFAGMERSLRRKWSLGRREDSTPYWSREGCFRTDALRSDLSMPTSGRR